MLECGWKAVEEILKRSVKEDSSPPFLLSFSAGRGIIITTKDNRNNNVNTSILRQVSLC